MDKYAQQRVCKSQKELENSLRFAAIYEKLIRAPVLKAAGAALATCTLVSSGLASLAPAVKVNGLTGNYY